MKNFCKKGQNPYQTPNFWRLCCVQGLIPTGRPAGVSGLSGARAGRAGASLPLGSRSGLLGLSSLSCNQLQQIRGIGEVKAVRICCIFELARRIALGQRKASRLSDPATAADYCRPMFEEDGGMLERTILLLLDGKGCLIREKASLDRDH